MTWGNMVALLFYALDANTGLHIGMGATPYYLLRLCLQGYDSIKLNCCQVAFMQNTQVFDNIKVILSDNLHNIVKRAWLKSVFQNAVLPK